ncbi:MAG TPA: aspartyl protease family protein [Phenylobacterium sp.]|nr:aspartyl protease family protein [Phenylobacterium sp.]
MKISRRAMLAAAGLTVPGIARADDGVVFPFAVTRNMPWAAVQLNGVDPAMPFLIDTGSSGFGILQAKAEELKLAKMGKALSQAAVGRANIAIYEASLVLGGAVRQSRTSILGVPHLPRPMLGLIPLPRIQLMAMDFDRREVLLINRLPDAMEGYQALEIDAGRGELGSANIMGAYATEQDARLGRDQRPVIDAEFDGELVKLMVDTGFGGGLHLNPDYVKKRGLWNRSAAFAPVRLGTVLGPVGARMIRAERLKIGRLVFANPIVSLGDPADSDLDGTRNVAGLIGMEFIRRVNLVVHPTRRRLWIKPNSAITDGYRYDRAGADVEIIDKAARIAGLAPGSPADRAGLRAGDKVTGWRGRDGIEGLSWALKGAPGSKVEIQIERNGKTELVAVVLEERI